MTQTFLMTRLEFLKKLDWKKKWELVKRNSFPCNMFAMLNVWTNKNHLIFVNRISQKYHSIVWKLTINISFPEDKKMAWVEFADSCLADEIFQTWKPLHNYISYFKKQFTGTRRISELWSSVDYSPLCGCLFFSHAERTKQTHRYIIC